MAEWGHHKKKKKKKKRKKERKKEERKEEKRKKKGRKKVEMTSGVPRDEGSLLHVSRRCFHLGIVLTKLQLSCQFIWDASSLDPVIALRSENPPAGLHAQCQSCEYAAALESGKRSYVKLTRLSRYRSSAIKSTGKHYLR